MRARARVAPLMRSVNALNAVASRRPRGARCRCARRTASTRDVTPLERTYRYLIVCRDGNAPVSRRTAWTVRGRLDIDAMRTAAQHLVGRHDFAAFGSAPRAGGSTVRTVTSISVDRNAFDAAPGAASAAPILETVDHHRARGRVPPRHDALVHRRAREDRPGTRDRRMARIARRHRDGTRPVGDGRACARSASVVSPLRAEACNDQEPSQHEHDDISGQTRRARAALVPRRCARTDARTPCGEHRARAARQASPAVHAAHQHRRARHRHQRA